MKTARASVDNIRVSCRFRPPNAAERQTPFCVDFDGSKHVICRTVQTPRGGTGGYQQQQQVSSPRGALTDETGSLNGCSAAPHDCYRYSFSCVYGPDTTQEELYNEIAAPIVDDVMSGYNGTILVYGQTGSGKTHTMFGPNNALGSSTSTHVNSNNNSNSTSTIHTTDGSPVPPLLNNKKNNPLHTGIAPRALRHLFHSIRNADAGVEFEIRLMCVEVYMERVRDLLTGDVRHIREDPTGFYVANSAQPYITHPDEALQLLRAALRRRVTSSTAHNDASSRSHCVVSITVRSTSHTQHEARVGKLFLVDLAGCEKVSRTQADGLQLEEAKRINKSLTTLGHVIISLAERQAHVPYRDSKLTRILKESLGGNSRTALIVCCSPSQLNAHETLSSLRFGARAQNVCNRAVVNRQLTMEELKSMLDIAKIEIQKLRRMLKERVLGNNNNNSSTSSKNGILLMSSPSPKSLTSASSPQATSPLPPLPPPAITTITTANTTGVEEIAGSTEIRLTNPQGGCASPTRDESVSRSVWESATDDDSVEVLLHQGAREQLSLSDLRAEVERLREALRDAESRADTLRTQYTAQSTLVEILQEESNVWEEEYTKVMREVCAQRRCADHYRALLQEARDGAGLLPRQLTAYIEQLRSIHIMLEQYAETTVVVSSPCRRAGRKLCGMTANHLTPVTSGRHVQSTEGATTTTNNNNNNNNNTSAATVVEPVMEASSMQTLGTQNIPVNKMSSLGKEAQTQNGVSDTHQDEMECHYCKDNGIIDNNDNNNNNNGEEVMQREELLLSRLNAAVDELELLRNANGALTLELQLAEKKLTIRHERIETLKFALRQECAANQELQQTLENERTNHRAQLVETRNDALYWRQRYDDLLNNSHTSSSSSSRRRDMERNMRYRNSTPALEVALSARSHRPAALSPSPAAPHDGLLSVSLNHGIVVKSIRGGGHKGGRE